MVSRIADKITTFSLVAVGGFLLLVSLIASVAVSVILNYFEHIFPVPDVVSYPINLFIPFFITTIFFALIYKILPEVKLKWKYALLGGSIASFLFTLGQYLLSLYITHSAVVSVYGAAASLLVVLLWVYYSSQILYIGAEFTKSYLHQKNIALIPKNNAEFYSLQTPEKHERKSASVDTAISYFLSSFFVNVLRKSRERGIKKD